MIEDEVFVIEDDIIHVCALYNVSRTLVDDLINELFNYTALTQKEVYFVNTEFELKKNEKCDDISANTLYKWTRFTSTKLYQLKRFG